MSVNLHSSNRHLEHADLPDEDLFALLKERDAFILKANTGQLGFLFRQIFERYDRLVQKFKEAPFGHELYTPQSQFPSLSYPQNHSTVRIPHGIGKAPDILHQSFRYLGIRLTAPFIAPIQALIGTEANIRIFGPKDKQTGMPTVLKDRPPNEEARSILERTKEITIRLIDQLGMPVEVVVPNDRKQVIHRGESFCLLETALALREQSIAVNSRVPEGGETLKWVRRIIAQQSVQTLVQVQEILECAIKDQVPGATLADFNLIVRPSDRLKFARSVFERAHEARRDFSLYQIMTTHNRQKSGSFDASTLALQSIGETAEGFEIRDTHDAAAVIFAIPEAFRYFQYAFPKFQRRNVVASSDTEKMFASLAESVFYSSNLAHASVLIRQRASLIQAVLMKNNNILQALVARRDKDPQLGIVLAIRLLRSMMDRTFWLPTSSVNEY